MELEWKRFEKIVKEIVVKFLPLHLFSGVGCTKGR